MKYEGINFYPAAAEGKTFKEFCEHEKHHGLSEKQMREVYALLKGKDKTVKIEKPLTDQENQL